MRRISIIIPTLNEANYVRQTITHLLSKAKSPESLEIILIDAGSQDDTIGTVSDLPVRTFSKPWFALKKYASLNFGIKMAKSDVLLFLDADTMLPTHFDWLIEQKLKNAKVVGGAFEFSFANRDWKLASLQFFNRIRYRFGKVYYGDQAVFCRKEVADAVGGFPTKMLMESAYFCEALKKKGKLSLIKKSVKTSPRRFNEKGFFKVFWFDVTMWLRFAFNFSVEEYGLKYWGFNMKVDD